MKCILNERELNQMINEELEDILDGDDESIGRDDDLDSDTHSKEAIAQFVFEKMKDFQQELNSQFSADVLGENRLFLKQALDSAIKVLFR